MIENPGDGALHEHVGVLDAELLLDLVAVELDRFGAEVEALGDLAGRETAADQIEDLEFAIGESGGERRFRLFHLADHFLKHQLAHRRAEVQTPLEDAADGGDDVLRRLLLVDVAAGAGAEDARREERFLMERTDEDQDVGMRAVNFLHELEPAPLLEREIDDGELRLALADQAEGTGDVSRFSADFEIGFGFDELADAEANELMVIDDEDAARAGRFRSGGRFGGDWHREYSIQAQK